MVFEIRNFIQSNSRSETNSIRNSLRSSKNSGANKTACCIALDATYLGVRFPKMSRHRLHLIPRLARIATNIYLSALIFLILQNSNLLGEPLH